MSKLPNVGDALHLIEIAVLLITLGMNYQRFLQIQSTSAQYGQAIIRIEHYLSSQDSQYWHKAKQNGDATQ